MTNILILFFLILVLLYISFFINNQDLFSPSVLMCLGFVLATASAMMNIDEWKINLHIKTVLVIIIGMISFILGELLINSKNKNYYMKNSFVENKLIYIDNYKIILFIIFDIVVIYLYYKEVVRIASLGHSYWQSKGLMAAFKMQSTYSTDVESAINSVVIQLSKLTTTSSYVFLFILINNLMNDIRKTKIKIKSNFKLLIPIFLYIGLQMIKGVRITLITMFVSTFFLINYFWHRKLGWNKKISYKFIKTGVISFAAFLVIFFITKEIVGRVSSDNFLDYITKYTGGSIQLLDTFLKDTTIKKDKVFLSETLTGFLISFNKMGIYDTTILKQLEFRGTDTGIYLGNVYTAFRRYYSDLGWLGLFIFPFILSCFMTRMYNLVKLKYKLSNKAIFRTIFYSYILYVIPTMAMEDFFYVNLSIGFIIEIIILYICIWFLLKCKIKLII